MSIFCPFPVECDLEKKNLTQHENLHAELPNIWEIHVIHENLKIGQIFQDNALTMTHRLSTKPTTPIGTG